MRIVISAEGENGLDSLVSPHFGRCPWFVLIDGHDQAITNVQAVANPYSARHAPGQIPEFISNHGADVMMTGGLGRRAIAMFEEYGITVTSGASGTVRQALEGYLSGQLTGGTPCINSQRHHERREHDPL